MTVEDPTEEPDLRAPGAAEEPASEAGSGPAGLTASEPRPAGGAQSPVSGGQSAVGGGVWSATGEPRVDAALARLDDLEGLPVTEHRAVFEDVHRRLSDVLGELDAGQAPTAGEAPAAGQAPRASEAPAPGRGAAHPANPGRPGR